MSILEEPIAVLGPGAWGTALALQLAGNGQPVRLWGNDVKQIDDMLSTGANEAFLPGHVFPDNLQVCKELATALSDVRDVLIVVPSQAFRSVLTSIKPMLGEQGRLLWATKGLDRETGDFLHQLIAEEFGESYPIAVLSGPSFAKEVADGLPTAVNLATNNGQFARDLIKRFSSEHFRLREVNDFIGVQLGGVLKNVLAIASGISDGLGFGANARSALITCGLSEMGALVEVLGGDSSTLMDLAGLGDLVLTCTDDQSRNRRFGLAIGGGASIEQAQEQIGFVVEGLGNVKQLYELAEREGVKVPIVAQVYAIIYQNVAPREALERVFSNLFTS